MEVRFYSSVKNSLLKFAVIVSMYQNQWVYCKHKQRDTYEVPGGHREAGEDILSAAKRELFEETGATEYDIRPVCAYSVDDHDGETFGMLYFADIKSFGELPAFEMEKVALFPGIPDKLTYPMIQPKLVEKAISAVFPEKLKKQEDSAMKYEWFDSYLLAKKGVEKDYKLEWEATRYMIRGKMFAMQGGDKYGKPILTMKLEPAFGSLLRQQYTDIVPGYYMNKEHWNSLYLEGNVPDETVREMLDGSYETLLNSFSKKAREEILG